MMHCLASIARKAAWRQGTSLALALLGVLALAACGGGDSSAPAAATLIQQAQQAITKDNAYHFNLKVDHPGTGGASGIAITSADGDVVRPDKIKGMANVITDLATFSVQFIGIGSQQWVLNPQTQQWTTPASLGVDIGTLPDPSKLISMVLGDMQHAKNMGDDTVDSGDCWLVEGTVPSGDLASLTGGDPTATTPIDTTVCVAKNADGKGRYQPYEFILKGMAADGDTAQTTRTFMLSKFDENVNIQPPQ